MSAAEERLANDPTSELWGEHRARYRFAGAYACNTDRVLDVACGSGFGLPMLARSGAFVVGVDYDAPTLCELKHRNPRVPLARSDATQLPLGDGSLDVVVSFETLEHVRDALALVRELRRVLRPGGRLVLSTPNRAFGPSERHADNPFHVREFTADELRGTLCEYFDDVQLYGQRPSAAYRYVPFLMTDGRYEPAALMWKVLVRLPFNVKNRLALALSGRPFYPGESDYRFDPDQTDGAHALVAVAR